LPDPAPVLPPLTWLRAFEATARHLSMARAAAELGVTPSAVSQQVKHLEDLLKRRLFVRRAGTLQLSEIGLIMLPKLTAGFGLLHEALADALPARGRSALKVRAPTSFASQWLVHRLDSFRKAHPEITVQISGTGDPIETSQAGLDCEIRYGHGPWADIQAELFLHEEVFPVCSPKLLTGRHPVRRPEDIAGHDVLDVPGYREGWPEWLRAAGTRFDWNERRIVFDQSIMAIRAAIEGKGIALGRSALVARELETGRLAAPFELRLPATGGYWLLHRAFPAPSRMVLAFKSWLLREASRYRIEFAALIESIKLR
jgi:LysR family glycine cleavage system transcriptional activator